MRFVAQPRRVRSRCVAASLCSFLSGGRGLATLSLWPAGSATRIAIGLGDPTRMPPLGLAIVPCAPAWYCWDTPGRLRLVRTLQAVCRRTIDDSWRTTFSLISNLTRDVQTTLNYTHLVVCYLLAWSRREY